MPDAVWAGVDVGGRRKGFHIALVDDADHLVGLRAIPIAQEVARWLADHRPQLVAVDSPLTAAPDGEKSRAGERELVAARVCNLRYTPDRQRLADNPAYYEWVEHGFELYAALASAGLDAIECFPTASWTRWAGPRGAKSRAAWSRRALDSIGVVGVPAGIGQDERDAIAAAMTARAHSRGETDTFGDIVVPRAPAAAAHATPANATRPSAAAPDRRGDGRRRLDSSLEAEGAEFFVLGQLLVEGIQATKAYTNFPGYDLIAFSPETNRSCRIQVKSRWATDYDRAFPIKNFDCDFVVHIALNRGYRRRASPENDGRRPPDVYVFPGRRGQTSAAAREHLGEGVSPRHREPRRLPGELVIDPRVPGPPPARSGHLAGPAGCERWTIRSIWDRAGRLEHVLGSRRRRGG